MGNIKTVARWTFLLSILWALLIALGACAAEWLIIDYATDLGIERAKRFEES